MNEVAEVVEELRGTQGTLAATIKSKVMIENQLKMRIARLLGYAGRDTPMAERKKFFNEADKVIKAVVTGKGKNPFGPEVVGIVKATHETMAAYEKLIHFYERRMEVLAAQLPVAGWAKKVRGFGLLRLAVVVGETGDLNNYAGPARVWKRLGCAPFQKGDAVRMGSTWRSKGGLSAAEWEEFGYSPRKRSIAFILGDLIVKANKGKYRARYDETKAKKLAEGWSLLHAHKHGMLLATKLLLKDLWREWTGLGDPPSVTDDKCALARS